MRSDQGNRSSRWTHDRDLTRPAPPEVSQAVLAALLALTASFLWGTSDFIGGYESRRATVWAVALVSQVVALATGLVILAFAAPAGPIPVELIAPIVAGIAITLSALAEYRAMELAEMSVVAPIFAGAAMVPVAWGLASATARGSSRSPAWR